MLSTPLRKRELLIRAKIVAPDYSVTQLKGIKEMNFGSFEAQPEHLLPKHRPGSRSLKISLVPYGGEDIREVGQRVLKTVLEKAEAHTKDGAENLPICQSWGGSMGINHFHGLGLS